jgi:hypothetical protein
MNKYNTIQWNITGNKENKVLMHDTRQMSPENTLIERNQSEKINIVWFHLCKMLRISKPTERK